MTNRTIPLDDRLYEYLRSTSLREPEIFRQLREETAKLPQARMQVSPEQGQFMALLAQLVGAKRAIEIGTFTGYSALWIASALPEDGVVVTCDLNEEWTRIARRFWQEAGLAHRIDLRMGPAQKTLDRMLSQPEEVSSYDFIFIDADKIGYEDYYQKALRLLRPGGIVALDNMFRGGHSADDSVQDTGTMAVREINLKVRDDKRVSSSLVPIGDGLLIARKRG